ncbi:hypothetical protein [Rhodococcoides kroppenstedtii]|uniref:hypothetical protein n=1 Tax=Rhodococcoides kroppenstedtii TaxID=293050 RepID=UPI001BDEA892|nr:hypothetical protein [Rhodococcus kroppenstedtii]MBT1191104.1 hypothetical protein [Rhodococcus kroppenstedtii]
MFKMVITDTGDGTTAHLVGSNQFHTGADPEAGFEGWTITDEPAPLSEEGVTAALAAADAAGFEVERVSAAATDPATGE